MGLTRRSFLGSILALGAAPAIVRADSLMKVIPREAALLWDDPRVLMPWTFENRVVILNEQWMCGIEEQIGARMALTRQLVLYNVLRPHAQLELPS